LCLTNVMINKILHLITALLVFLTTSGVVINHHYCSGTMVSTTLMHVPKPCCGEEHDCCQNHTDVYQLDEMFLLIALDFDFSDLPLILPELNSEIELQYSDQPYYPLFYTSSHPPNSEAAQAVLQQYRL